MEKGILQLVITNAVTDLDGVRDCRQHAGPETSWLQSFFTKMARYHVRSRHQSTMMMIQASSPKTCYEVLLYY